MKMVSSPDTVPATSFQPALSMAAATLPAKITGNGELSIVNPAKGNPLAYPISTFTYVIVPTSSSKGAELRKMIYWAVTKGHMPWRSVWPGALFFALVTSAGNYIFPLYLTSVSDLHRIGGTIGFILIALVWFYAISLALLAGAVINSLRHESDDTGALPLEG